VLMVIAGGLVLTGTRDGDAPDDSDLRALPVAPPDFANAQLTLTSAAALLVRDTQDSRWPALASGEAWDDALVPHALTANEAALRAFERAARQPTFQSSGAETAEELVAWIDLARLQGVRAISLARAGEPPAAVAAAVADLRVARLVAGDARGTQLVREVAEAMADASWRATHEVLRHVALGVSDAHGFAGELAAARADATGVRSQLVAAYRDFAGADAPAADLPPAALSPALRWLSTALPARHRIQPNNTLALYAERARARIAAADESCAADDTTPLFTPSLRSVVAANSEGRSRIDSSSALDDVRRSACRWNTRIEALRAALAVQQFERERSALPPSLESLVPDHLPEPPRDWFGDGALRLDRGAREIVSFGAWDVHTDAGPREERFPLLPAPAAP